MDDGRHEGNRVAVIKVHYIHITQMLSRTPPVVLYNHVGG